MYINELKFLEIEGKFKMFPHVVCGSDKKLYQLVHFKKRRTCYFKKLTYNSDRKAYRINSQWVTKKRLLKLIILKKETITI
jgi:hypothetical protein